MAHSAIGQRQNHFADWLILNVICVVVVVAVVVVVVVAEHCRRWKTVLVETVQVQI